MKEGDEPFEAVLKVRAYKRGLDRRYPSAVEWKLGYDFAAKTADDGNCRVGTYEVTTAAAPSICRVLKMRASRPNGPKP